MYALQGLTWLLLLQTLGELLVRQLGLPLPGPVVGMGLLWLALRWTPVREPVEATARFILAHLSLLFVPVGVGVMAHLPLLSDWGWRLAVTLVLSTWIGLAATALVLRALWSRKQEAVDA